MLKPLLLAAATLLAAAAESPLPLAVGGRAVAEENGALRFGWPGTAFEARFDGRQVAAEVDTRADFFRLLIDGVERARLGPGNLRVTIADLPAGPHSVRLEMMTENQSGSSRFLGFRTPGTPLAPSAPRRSIEFIGDSHSVGYGNLSPTRDCNAQRVHDMTDTQQAFGPLLAKRLDAAYRVIAYSGFGVVRNYAGGNPGDSLPNRYPRAIPGKPGEAPADGWKPGWIVINLGTNDFSTPVKPGERWADQAALRADYRARYAAFVRMLAARQPQARFVLMAHPDWAAEVRAVANALGPVAKIAVVETPPLELTGCNWHPSLRDHRAIAAKLEPLIARE